MKFWILNKILCIDACDFQIITNLKNNANLFQWHHQYSKYKINSYLFYDINNIFFGGVQGSKLKPFIYYTLSLPTELSSQGLTPII